MASPTGRPPRSPVGAIGPAAAALALALALSLVPGDAAAQAHDAPALQPPHADRGLGMYFTYLDDGDAPGVAVTWRRPGEDFGWGLRGGASDFAGAAALTLGGELKGRVTRAGEDFPLTVWWVTGAGVGTVPDLDRTLLRVPAGLSVGRSFGTEGFAFTPYAHPRLGMDFLFRDAPAGDDTDLSFDLEFGLDVNVRESWGLRFGVTVGEHDAVGGGLVFETF